MRDAIVMCSVVVMTLFASHDSAYGQDANAPASGSSPSKWDLEVHAGISSSRNQLNGSGSLPSSGTLIGGEVSASTFYLGDGARLFNDNQRVFAGPSAPVIVPIDTVLVGAVTRREAGPAFGVRLQRGIRERFAVEVDGDVSLDHLAFTPAALTAIEATRASYIPALQRALAASPLSSSVTSVATITDRRLAPQLFGTAAFLVKFRTSAKTVPYIAGGGGVVMSSGDAPGATLLGNYSVDSPAQLLGTDNVVISHDETGLRGVGLAGGGFTHAINEKWGIRVDARENFYSNAGTNSVTITPTLGFQSTGRPVPLVDAGALKFAPTAPLNGASLSLVKTFTGTGLQAHFFATAGVVLRF